MHAVVGSGDCAARPEHARHTVGLRYCPPVRTVFIAGLFPVGCLWMLSIGGMWCKPWTVARADDIRTIVLHRINNFVLIFRSKMLLMQKILITDRYNFTAGPLVCSWVALVVGDLVNRSPGLLFQSNYSRPIFNNSFNTVAPELLMQCRTPAPVAMHSSKAPLA